MFKQQQKKYYYLLTTNMKVPMNSAKNSRTDCRSSHLDNFILLLLMICSSGTTALARVTLETESFDPMVDISS